MHNEACPKSDSISMERVEGKPQLNVYGNASPHYWENKEQLIAEYQANTKQTKGFNEFASVFQVLFSEYVSKDKL